MTPTDGLDLSGPEADELLRPAAELAIEMARAGARLQPPAEVPTRIRPLLRHAKLTRAALAVARRVLAEDDDFRERVAVAAAMPTGEDTLGRASVLWVCRPEGWEAELAQLVESARTDAGVAAEDTAARRAQRRLGHAEEARDRAERAAEAADLVAEEARIELAEERRQRRAAADETARLGRRLAAVEEQLAAARRAVEWAERRLAEGEKLRAEVLALRAAAEDRQHRLQAEVDASRDAAAFLVAALEQVARAMQPEGEGVTAAALEAGGVGAARPPTEFRAGRQGTKPRWARQPRRGSHRRPARLPPFVHEDSAEAAEHLVTLAGVALLVDGYNMTLSTWPDLPLPEQRVRLIDALAELAARTGARPEVIFDGANVSEEVVGRSFRSLVNVRFTAADVEADDVLIARAHHLPLPVVVASDDRRVRAGAQAAGANVLGIAQLLAALRRKG